MRKQLFIFTLMLLPLLAIGQTMKVHMKNGDTKQFNISEIEYVDFGEKEEGEEVNPVLVDYHRAYEQAFVEKFGLISPNQDWGFGKFRTRGSNDGIRIITEDVTSKDFDFNDVVFDVEWTQDGTKIRLQAIGTNRPVFIADKEVHEMFGIDVDEMVNVGTGLAKAPVSFTLPSFYDYNPKNIPIRAFYSSGTWVELKADQGAPASKIAVGTDYKWCDENQAINEKYPDFVSWVQGNTQNFYSTEQEDPGGQTTDVYIDENTLGQAWIALYSQLSQCNAIGKDIEAKYTGIVNDEAFKAPVSPSNQNIYNFWGSLFTSIRRNIAMSSYADSYNKEPVIAMCNVLDALAYEELTTYFGDVPYLTKDVDPMSNISRTPISTIVDDLITRISQTKAGAKNRQGIVISSLSNLDELSSPSVDLVNLVLAELFIAKGDYQTAKNYLIEIINSGHYSLQSYTTRNGLENDYEILFSLKGSETEESIIRTYSDVLLLIAECENMLGNVAASKSYITQVVQSKFLIIDQDNLPKAIAQVRCALQNQTNGYFAYLKRNGLAQELLGLEDYQLLLPIPLSELAMNPSLIQNSGY